MVWAGWLLGPGSWALHENLSYVLVPWVCGTGNLWTLHLTTLVTLAVAIATGALSWHGFQKLRSHSGSSRVRSRRFLALGGLILCAFSAVGIVVEGIPNFVIDPCARAA